MIRILRQRKGVTLVELLAVIVIMAIITAIAVPTIGNLIERTNQGAAAASGNSTIVAIGNYVTDYPDYLSDAYDAELLTTELPDIAAYLTDLPEFVNITFTVSAAGVVTPSATVPAEDMTINGFEVAIEGGQFTRP